MEDIRVEELKKGYGCDNKLYTWHELEKLLALSITLYKYNKLDQFPVLGIDNVEGRFHLFKKENNTWESYLCVDGIAKKRTYENYPQYYAIESMLQNIFNISPYDSKYTDYFYRFCDIDVTHKELELYEKVIVDKKGNEKEQTELLELIKRLFEKYDDERVYRYYRPLLNYDIIAGRRESSYYSRHELEQLYSLFLTIKKYKEDKEELGPFMNADSLSGGTYIIKNPLGCFEVFDVDEERGYVFEPRLVFEKCEKACIEVINQFMKNTSKTNQAYDFFYKTYNSNITDEELDNFRFFFLTGCMMRRLDKNRQEEKQERIKQYNLTLKNRGVINEE